MLLRGLKIAMPSVATAIAPRWKLPAEIGIGFAAGAAESPARVTIIYDAFGKPSDLERGWGYSALIEYGGKRILFDTGGQYAVFAENVRKLKIDLKSLDFVVLSHRHGDHTSGLAYVLQQNPKVKIYAPLEGALSLTVPVVVMVMGAMTPDGAVMPAPMASQCASKAPTGIGIPALSPSVAAHSAERFPAM